MDSLFLRDIDLNDMRSMIEAFPKLLGSVAPSEMLLELTKRYASQKISGICMLGMGGSAIAGKLCSNLLVRRAKVPLICIQDYHVPEYLDSSWIAIATSYSGNTEETIASTQEAIARKCKILAITSGGKLASILDEEQVAEVPCGFQPRAALPILFSVQLKLLETILGYEYSDLSQVGMRLQKKANSWSTHIRIPDDLARSLYGRIPLFIGSQATEAAAYRAKCQINENAKHASFYSVLPEANHNEIESISVFDRAKIQPIFLRSMTESPRLTERIEATSSIYEREVERCIHIKMKAETELEEILQLVYYLDLLSLELATLYDADPVKVERIAHLKKALSGS